MRVLFVLPAQGGGGGAHSVSQEVNELVKMGVNAKIAVNEKNYPSFLTCYSDMPNVSRNVLEYKNSDDLAKHLERVEVVVCTIFTSVKAVKEALVKSKNKPKITYYAQDYEPLFTTPENPLWKEAYDSYTLIPNMTIFAKTDWIRNIIAENHGVAVRKVNPSIDHDVYFPGLNKSTSQVWISAMVRPSTPRRAPQRTMRVLKNIFEKYGKRVKINVFGCSEVSMFEHGLPRDFPHFNHGILTRNQVSALLRKSHLFIDLSDYQAFGRTGLEAMACACSSLVPVFGGTDEYIIHGENGYAVDPRDEKVVIDTISEFIELTYKERNALISNSIETAQGFSVRKAALSEWEMFNDILSK